MSEITIFGWRIARDDEDLRRDRARENRERQYRERVRATTQHFRDHYRNVFEDLVEQGLRQYLPDRFNEIESQLDELDDLLGTDPIAARELSLELAPQISQLPALARAARREFQECQRQRERQLAEMRRQARSELDQILQNMFAQIEDPVEQDFALDDLRALRQEYSNRTVLPEELPHLEREIQQKLALIRKRAKQKAEQWRRENAQQVENETRQSLLALHIRILEERAGGDPHARARLERLHRLAQLAEQTQMRLEEFQAHLAAEIDTVDQPPVNEDDRRKAVRAILESLTQAGFVVESPRLLRETDEVLIRAKKPSGPEASFAVRLDGTMMYKFDRYEGMQCKADIDKVLPLLQDIYGIKLSDKRVIWQNPDRVSRSARPIDLQQRDQSHGQSS